MCQGIQEDALCPGMCSGSPCSQADGSAARREAESGIVRKGQAEKRMLVLQQSPSKGGIAVSSEDLF